MMLMIFLSTLAEASHIVGGQISYNCLGDHNYEIRLRVYRDCGGNGIVLDANANIAIYDKVNNLVRMISPPRGTIINVPPNATGNPCISAPPGLCTEYADYIDTVKLPPINWGYVITHQRCCRNNSITNVISPGTSGNVFTVRIPSMDISCNSSAEFTGVAPIVVCLNEPLNVPMVTADHDGDSLYFALCDVYFKGVDGLGCNVLIPNPPCPPPYSVLAFKPPFSSSYPMPSSPAIAIDPVSGILSGTPTALGRYTMGICVSEFRNGTLLSTTRLDYQFNVAHCEQYVVSDMITHTEDPQLLCQGLKVDFTSESQNASSLLWDFGDIMSVKDTSSDPNPTFIYKAPGDYTVTLIANPGLQCADTMKVLCKIRREAFPDFTHSGNFCFDGNEIIFEAVGDYALDATFEWDFGTTANIPFWGQKIPPPVSWNVPGTKVIKFTVRYGVCERVKIDTVEINTLSLMVDAGPDQTIMAGEVIRLSATGGGQLGTYYWFSDHSVDFSDPFSQYTSSELRDGADTVKFYVRVTDAFGCESVDSMYIFVKNPDGPINFFSPNGDGLNDYLDLSEINPHGHCYLSVLNRWGAEVFFAANYQNNWTGVNQGGKELPDGTYYYVLKCRNEIKAINPVTIARFR